MAKTTTVRLYFPNIDKEFVYEYPYDIERNRVRDAMADWYDKEADLYFALYGYGPMDVSVSDDGVEVARYRSCYQETLWHSFFREGGESWHGRFSHFDVSLFNMRYREDMKKAA